MHLISHSGHTLMNDTAVSIQAILPTAGVHSALTGFPIQVDISCEYLQSDALALEMHECPYWHLFAGSFFIAAVNVLVNFCQAAWLFSAAFE